MKTDQITFGRDGYGKKKDDGQAHHINNQNGVEAEMEVDFERRVVWVTTNRDEYFTPFEALCMVKGKRKDAGKSPGASLAKAVGDAVSSALSAVLGSNK